MAAALAIARPGSGSHPLKIELSQCCGGPHAPLLDEGFATSHLLQRRRESPAHH